MILQTFDYTAIGISLAVVAVVICHKFSVIASWIVDVSCDVQIGSDVL